MRAVAILAMLSAASVATNLHAYMLVPDRDNPRNLIVAIERPAGDEVKFATLPPPFNTALQSAQGPGRFSFRWNYAKGQTGLAYLNVDERGHGALTFEFSNTKMVDGDSFGAAAVLISKGGRPLHTFYARADVQGAPFEGETDRQRIRLTIERPPGWWKGVGAITFHYMKYARHQELDDAEMWQAMRSVVEIFTKGEGSEQRQ